MEVLKRITRAAFVLPFTAGNTLETNNGETCHDGSLAGLVLMTTSVAILCEILIIGYTTEDVISSSLSFHLIVLTCLSLLGSCVCLAICLYMNIYRGTVRHPLGRDICNTIRIRFLWIFCFSCIAYKALQITIHIDCMVKKLRLEHGIELVVYDCTCIVFYVLQTGFITHFSQSRFTSHLGVYYGLLFLILTNISVICRALVTSIMPIAEHSNTTRLANTSYCYETSSMISVEEKLDPFLKPSICEYSLVSILFIMKMWPTYEMSHDDVLDLNNLSSGNAVNVEPTRHRTDNENTPLMRNFIEGRYDGKHRVRRIASMITPILLNLPSVILYCVRVSGVPSVDLPLNIAIAVEASIELILSVKCYYSLQVQCKPDRRIIRLDSSDYILIASVVTASSYLTIKLVSNIFMVNLTNTYALSMYRLAVYIVSGYLQTVFILQMKRYEKVKLVYSWLSIEYSCLFVSFINLSAWAVDTFIVSQYIFRNDAAYQFYGQSAWEQLFTFLYPFVIFYRFNAFVFFYGLYDELKLK